MLSDQTNSIRQQTPDVLTDLSPTADAAELVSNTKGTHSQTPLKEEDMQAARTLLQLSKDDASLAHSNMEFPSDTESEATTADYTLRTMNARQGQHARWSYSTSPTESAAARRRRLVTNSPRFRPSIPVNSRRGHSEANATKHDLSAPTCIR